MLSVTNTTSIGKPEPLKGDLSGYWSVRIDDKIESYSESINLN
ncbi:type II toxin-antitoxin system YoeB family toxin [Varibaculum cambriense]|nr:type II toxin-antitoxin system YoeB family toxin [Varibaculum cambriense]MDU5541524.1 type II toxin-antitoxin system YoeB family toxin [Varibaculum cambriense]